MAKLGHQHSVSPILLTKPPPLSEKIRAIHGSLYRRSDFGAGGLHGGIFMFRDVFARVTVPIILGTIAIKPYEMTDLSEMQVRWLYSVEHDRRMFLDQFADIFDFAGGTSGLAHYKPPPKDAAELFGLAAFQLQAAAATLSAAFDFRGAIQSALIGAELSLKGGLAAAGVDENARRKHGHNLTSAAQALDAARSGLDVARVLATTKRLPAYVENRYSPTQPNRVETGHIVMGAQYIAGEVVRQISGHSIRPQFDVEGVRVYPAIQT